MRVLLDTHVFLWAIDEYERLSTRARHIIEDPANELFLSTASIWEILLKASRGKVLADLLPETHADFLREHIGRLGVEVLAVGAAHVFALPGLPRLHSDPFDRLLMAQAQTESLPLLTSDAAILEYSLETIW